MIEELAKQKIIQNNWYEKDQQWYCPKTNERRAHELYCSTCRKHIMWSQLEDHLQQSKHIGNV